ncbi:MAG TPA: hypothetical protein VEQ16_10445 [Acidocella sp.]|jgi:hypothetical protein|nr:hypothetical protein [Acidocella sp.]
MTRKLLTCAASFLFILVWGQSLPGQSAPLCDLRPASSWYTTITAGDYRLLFDDDADLGASPQIEHAQHGNSFVTDTNSFRIAGPNGTCWASPEVGIVTMPVFIANGRTLYIPTYSGSNAYLFAVDAPSCKTLWQSPGLDGGLPTRKPYGFFLPGVGRVFIGADCLPRITP